MPSRMSGPLVAAGLVLMWSSGFVGAELGTREASADTLLMWRFLVAAALLGGVRLLLRAARGNQGARLPPRALAEQSAIGLLSQGVYLGAIVWAVGLGVPAGTSALIAALQPLAAGALAGRLLGETVTRRQWAGLVLGLAGVALVVRDDLASPSAAPPAAYLLPFAGMAGLLAASFLERRARHRVPAADALPLHCVVSALLFTALAAFAGHGRLEPPATGEFWLAVTWVVVLSTVGGYGFYWLSLRRSGVTRTSALIYLTPPTTVVWAYVMFGERPGPLALLGMVVAVLGVVVSVRSPHVRTHPSGRPSATSVNEPSAKELQSGAARYDRHDRNDSWLEPSADRDAGRGGSDRADPARRIGTAARRAGQGALRRRLRLLQPADRPGVKHSSGAADTITVDTAAVPADVQKIVVTASLDAQGATFVGYGAHGHRPRRRHAGCRRHLHPAAARRRDGARRRRGLPPRRRLEGARRGPGVRERPRRHRDATSASTWRSRPRPPPPRRRAPGASGAPARRRPRRPAPAPPHRLPPRPRPPTGKINLDKGKVSLQKNQTVSLTKGGRPVLTSVKMGLGWEPAYRAGRRAKEIDLDASVIAYDANRKKIDACYFGKLAILNGVVQHSGDNLTGEGGGDDEVITVHLGEPAPAGHRAGLHRQLLLGAEVHRGRQGVLPPPRRGHRPGAGPLRPQQRGAAHGRADVQARAAVLRRVGHDGPRRVRRLPYGARHDQAGRCGAVDGRPM